MTAAMLLLVFTLVEAPDHGFLSARTLGSLAGVAVLLGAFVWRERHAASPLVRLGILRSGSARAGEPRRRWRSSGAGSASSS